MSYQPKSYGSQSNACGNAQDSNNWSGESRGGNHEATSSAAEVLHNMSNTTYSPSTSTQSQPTSVIAHAAATQYASNLPQSQHPAHSQQHTKANAARPRSANAKPAKNSASRGITLPSMQTGYLSHRPHNTDYSQPPQRTASSAQPQYATSSSTPASSSRAAAIGTATGHCSNDSRRHMPTPETTRYQAQAAQPVPQTASTHVSEIYGQTATTVDPIAVYDPWPEYQRKKAEEDRKLKAIRKEEEPRQEEEHRREEEFRKEEERRREERRKEGELHRLEVERKQQEEAYKRKAEEQKTRLLEMNRQTSLHKPQAQPPPLPQAIATPPAPESRSSGDAAESMEEDMEEEIRKLMAKMREYNSKNPALLARIWEEERRAKAPKSPTVQQRPVAQAAPVPKPSPAPQAAAQAAPHAAPRAAPVHVAPSADMRRNPIPRPLSTAPPPAQPALRPVPSPMRARGGTAWPQEKKAHLSSVAAAYLDTHNPQRHIEPADILRMLNGNPSYIELCEQLEAMGLKLDRGAFARSLLTAVPDVNSASQANATQGPMRPANGIQPAPPAIMKTVAPRAVMKVAPPPAMMKTPVRTMAPTPPAVNYASAHPVPNRPQYPPFPGEETNIGMGAPLAVPEMVPVYPERKSLPNKEEAAKKRNFNDLIDLTQLPDEDDIDMEPPPKRLNIESMHQYEPPYEVPQANVPLPARPQPQPASVPPPVEFRHHTLAEPIDRKKALRRNQYNIATIARDVLLACGRHPETRQLNQHLDILKSTLGLYVSNDTDLSTLRWDLIDPGSPPPGYFVDGVLSLADDADDEDDSEAERPTTRRESTDHSALPAPPLEAVNPFKKRRGRPPRHSLPEHPTELVTPKRTAQDNMSASASRAGAGVGYAAFRSATQHDANGNPLPKKKGRPVGWRKNIHGSVAALTPRATNGNAPSQSSVLRTPATRDKPIQINSRSPSVNSVARYQSFKCKWKGCKADLHNLDTLKKHVMKVHRMLMCFWDDCGTKPRDFDTWDTWREHLERAHFEPLSWSLGDGPASGLSDFTDSEAYLNDAQGRRVTPRITAPDSDDESAPNATAPDPRGPKNQQEQEATELLMRMVSQKRRLGGPGMDRGGATLVTAKRRRGFIDDDELDEMLVDAED